MLELFSALSAPPENLPTIAWIATFGFGLKTGAWVQRRLPRLLA